MLCQSSWIDRSEITAILESKQAHPLLNQMANPDVRDDMPIADCKRIKRIRPPRGTLQVEVPILGIVIYIYGSVFHSPQKTGANMEDP